MTTPLPTDLSDHVEWFKREVAVPGTFTALFPTTTDDDLAAALVDGLYRAKLDGWLPRVDASPDTFETNEPISLTAVAVIIVYAGVKFLQNQITNMATRTTYKAPGVEATTEHSANALKERLTELATEKKDLLISARQSRGGTPVFMQDGYAIRVSAMFGREVPVYVGNIPAELTRY